MKKLVKMLILFCYLSESTTYPNKRNQHCPPIKFPKSHISKELQLFITRLCTILHQDSQLPESQQIHTLIKQNQNLITADILINGTQSPLELLNIDEIDYTIAKNHLSNYIAVLKTTEPPSYKNLKHNITWQICRMGATGATGPRGHRGHHGHNWTYR